MRTGIDNQNMKVRVALLFVVLAVGTLVACSGRIMVSDPGSSEAPPLPKSTRVATAVPNPGGSRLPVITKPSAQEVTTPWFLNRADQISDRIYLSSSDRGCKDPIGVHLTETNSTVTITVVATRGNMTRRALSRVTLI